MICYVVISNGTPDQQHLYQLQTTPRRHLSNSRRCITPELGKTEALKERKQLILDLRRTHSQETLYWRPSSDISGATTVEDVGSSAGGGGAKQLPDKSMKKLNTSKSLTKNSQNGRHRSKGNSSNNNVIITATIPEEDANETHHTHLKQDNVNNKERNILNNVSCINEQEMVEDGHHIRRGKRCKKLKSSTNSNGINAGKSSEVDMRWQHFT